MPIVAQKPKESGDTSLRDRLIDVAEALYAEHGFSDVSFRQICVAAGARNNFAVQYHFGDLEKLACAIVTKRSLIYEVKRGERLARAVRKGPLTIRDILEIMERPIIEQVDANGDPIGARFMVALQNTSWGWKPLSDELKNLSVTQQLIRSLEELLPALPPPVVWQRLYLSSLMIMNCAAQIPRHIHDHVKSALMDNVFAMAAAALNAPINDAVGKAMLELYNDGALYPALSTKLFRRDENE